VLRALAGAGAGATSALAGCSALDPGDDGETTEPDAERTRTLAERFAPAVYFDANERWFPTDPRPYASDRDGRTVVDGFDALDGYAARYDDPASPPAPTVFYHVVEYRDSPLAVVQYWFYSAFDQFTTNFHWHDWEVLHAFVDTNASEPQLYVASSHSRRVPNNEFLDPDPDRTPRILAELGSHSSALSINALPDRFQRFAAADAIADITNSALDGVETLAEIRAAYGLPRDEGGRLPYLVPELDGRPLHEDERLPSVERSDLVDEALTIRSLDALASPPADLPVRETGLVFRPADAEPAATGTGTADDGTETTDDGTEVAYELVPTAAVEHLAAFTGPQLSFEFAVPGFAEDAVASHITATGVPWEQPRYANPAADVSDPVHRAALSDRYDAIGEPAPVNRVAVAVTRTVASAEAPDGQGVTTTGSPVEAVALLESEPAAVPTFGGVAVAQGVPEGDHRLTVNRAGAAPHSETVRVGDGTTAAGVAGEIPLVDRADATKLAVDADGADSELTGLAVEDDFAGRLYDAPLSGPDAVYVHRGGAYTAEVRDSDDEVGAFRVTPADEARVPIEKPDTGKAVLATYLADVAEETRAQVDAAAGGAAGDDGDTPDGSSTPGRNSPGGERGASSTPEVTATDDGPDGAENAVQGLVTALGAVAAAARRAAERAEAGDRAGANEQLDAVATRLERVGRRLADARGDLPDGLGNATARRLDQAERRTSQARAAGKL